MFGPRRLRAHPSRTAAVFAFTQGPEHCWLFHQHCRAGERFDDIELQFGFFQVSMDDPSDLSLLRLLEPNAPEQQLRKLTTLLDVPVPAAAERIQRLHDHLGVSYFTLNKTRGTSWDTLEKLIAALR